MVSKGKRKNLVKRYPRVLTLEDVISQSLHCMPFPGHMLCGMTRGQFRHKDPSHQQRPNMSKHYKQTGWGRALP